MRKKTITDAEEIRSIIREYYLQLDGNIFEKLEEMDNFQLDYKLYKLTHTKVTVWSDGVLAC